jgi:cytidyltransferase-like protein
MEEIMNNQNNQYKKQIGIIGGTFDPIHYGHLIAASWARECLSLEKVIFMPAGTPPHKIKNNVLDPIHRYNMVLLAINDQPYFEVSSLEINRKGPSYTIDSAVELSEIHGENRNSARLAALIHDISKDIDNVEQINLANKYKIEIDKISAAQPSLLHGIIGSYIAKNNFGIIDREILNAIKYHTTGRANMSKLEKIIYLADYIEEDAITPLFFCSSVRFAILL